MRWLYPTLAGLTLAGGLAVYGVKEWSDRNRNRVLEHLVSQARQGELLVASPGQERWLRRSNQYVNTIDIFGDKTPEEFYIFEDQNMGKHLVLMKVDGRPASESLDKIFRKY